MKTPIKQNFPKYYNHDGKSKRIPKIVLGRHQDVVEMYFKLPVEVRKGFRQVIVNASDLLTFGPMKGMKFQKLLRSNSDEMRKYYKHKIFGAVQKETLAIQASQFFMSEQNNLY